MRSNPAVRCSQPPAFALLVALCLPGILTACGGPIRDTAESDLRRSIAESVKREINAADQSKAPRRTTRADRLAELEIVDRHLTEIDEDYNPANYPPPTDSDAIDNLDLFGNVLQTRPIALRQVITEAVRNNLALESARLGPAIREADLVQALAQFDWTFFAEFGWTDTDQPQRGINEETVNSSAALASAVGLRRNLESGGSFQVRQDFIYTDVRDQAIFGVLQPNPSYASAFALELNQPILRGAGSDVALSEVRVARNLERSEIEDLRGTLIDTITNAENAYWDLLIAEQTLKINAKLLERGVQVRDDIRIRRILDAKQAQIADAAARVERRRAEVIRSQNAVRRASDRLKQIMNSDEMPVTGEVLLVPSDAAIDDAIEYNLLDSILVAIDNRPDLRQSTIQVDTASIREQVAENAKLPLLDFQASVGLDGLDREAGQSFTDQYDREFINDFFLGLLFEQPIGNRFAEAGFRGARLSRMQSVIQYRSAVQNAIVEVKSSLDDVVTNYRLIGQAQVSRIAAAEVLRALAVEKELTDGGYTVERLNIELNNQESLAQAEIAEIAAVIDYNRAIARLHQVSGTSLDRNNVDFVVPDSNQLLKGERAYEYELPSPNPTPAPNP